MKEIIINTQSELDALPTNFQEFTVIKIFGNNINVSIKYKNSSVEAWENSSVEAWENSSVVARENSSVVARENSSVVARENSSVVAWENSFVVARENSSVEAWGNSSVEAWGNSSVVARENSSVVARENSSVKAWGNSSVEAWGNSSVEAWRNSSVKAWGNSSVEAWGNSSVEAWGNSCIYSYENSIILLFSFSVCFVLGKLKPKKMSKTATIIIPDKKSGTKGWLKENGVKSQNSKVILFKKVSKEFKTQENTENETNWKIGTVVTHKNYNPKTEECGKGKFHACSRPYFCNEFRSNRDDKYIAIEIKIKDLFAWEKPRYPHKIAFRSGRVLYCCDRIGKKIGA